MTIRDGDWKLFVREPRYFKEVDLTNWKDSRAPDGTTILAPLVGQATPAQYPGIKPIQSENGLQLFNLRKDPSESVNLAKENNKMLKKLMNKYKKFEASFKL